MKINTKTQKSIAEAYENYGKTNKDADKLITESWAPMIERTTGVKDAEKLAWMSQLAHNTAKSLNEDAVNPAMNSYSAFGGTYSPYSNLYNVPGVGDPVPAGRPAMTSGDFATPQYNGSGDKYPALLPMALKVAAKTIGFELVNTTPLAGPTGVLPYMDYVYTGSKQPYGATPGFDPYSENPQYANYRPTDTNRNYNFTKYGLPNSFKAAILPSSSQSILELKAALNGILTTGKKLYIDAPTTATRQDKLILEYIGWSRIDGDPMFRVLNGGMSLGEYFAAGSVVAKDDAQAAIFTLAGPKLVSMLEDNLQGYAGSGEFDRNPWIGTYQDGTVLYDPMSRGTGEMTAPRQISLQLFTKNVKVGTIQVACAVTQEQVTDLQKQWGIDVVKIVENAGINELSTTINRHITSRLFGLGWKNHCKLVEVEGDNANLNLRFTEPAVDESNMTPKFALPIGRYDDESNDYTGYTNVALPFRPFVVNTAAQFENRETLIKRIFTNILAASNWIQQRGRYGAATYVVTNITIATLLQSNAHYTFSPIENTVSQSAGQLYPIGTVCGLTVYVDPLMAAYDTRILVGRKGAKDEPGVHFCPYVMAEVVRTIAEGTMAPKLMIKSRYALVDAGFFPETQTLTFMVDTRGLL